MKSISIQEVSNALGVKVLSDRKILGYRIDSRLVEDGDLFFALRGSRADGHAFLEDVRARGAVAAVVAKDYKGESFGLELLAVDDVEAALQQLARELIQINRPLIVGVTGSLGKTTTKEFIAALLEDTFTVGKTHLNYNTKLTYPITLLNRSGKEDVLVVEMGMTEPGDMDRLVSIVDPDIAIITKIAWVHAANFPRGLEDIASFKADIFKSERTKICIFHHELYNYPEAIGKIGIGKQKVSFSLEDKTADYFLSSQYCVDERGIRSAQLDPPFQQAHVLHNLLAAVSVGRCLKIPFEKMRFSKLQLPKMRFEQFEKEGVIFINDAYNANPDSMKAALASIPNPAEGGKKIAVLGTMAGMGPNSEEIHRDVGRFAGSVVDELFVIGDEAKAIREGFLEKNKAASHYDDLDSLSKALKQSMRKSDVVLVKGSRIMELEKLFNFLK